MFELIYRREAINTLSDKRFSIELKMKHANENYGLWRLLLRDTEVKKIIGKLRELSSPCTSNGKIYHFVARCLVFNIASSVRYKLSRC